MIEGKSCGDCTLCCKLLPLDEKDKPKDVWCKECTPSNGCNIYDERPQACIDFDCMWLTYSLPKFMNPKKSKVVLSAGHERIFAYTDNPRVMVDIIKSDGRVGRFLNQMIEEVQTPLILINKNEVRTINPKQKKFINLNLPD